MLVSSPHFGNGVNVVDIDTPPGSMQLDAPLYLHHIDIARVGGYTLRQFENMEKRDQLNLAAQWYLGVKQRAVESFHRELENG